MNDRLTYEEFENKIILLEEKIAGLEKSSLNGKEFKESLELFYKYFSYIPSSN